MHGYIVEFIHLNKCLLAKGEYTPCTFNGIEGKAIKGFVILHYRHKGFQTQGCIRELDVR